MFKRNQPLIIQGRTITNPLAIRLAQYMTEERAAFVADLRITKQFTWRMISGECARAWDKPWGEEQDIGKALCELASAYMGEAHDYLDTQ